MNKSLIENLIFCAVLARRKKLKNCRFYYFKSIELGLSLRSSHRRCSVRKCFLRNFAKFSGKHLHQRLFFSQFAGLTPQLYLKRVNSTLTQLFSCEFCKISNNTFFYKTPPGDCFWSFFHQKQSSSRVL